MKGSPYSHLFSKTFGVRMSTEIESLQPELPYFSEHPETFYAIPLEVKGSSSLLASLDRLVAKDKLEDWNCDKYNRCVDATKRYAIKSLSNILIFNLKRFDYDYAAGRKFKVNDYFTFPTEINMRPWTQEGLWEADSGSKDTQRQKPEERHHSYYCYALVGILVHSGCAESGHYYSYIKVNKERGEWMEFNDHKVGQFDLNRLADLCFGGKHVVNVWEPTKKMTVPQEREKERSAYMLFYERIEKEEITWFGDGDGKGLDSLQIATSTRPMVHDISQDLYDKVWKENQLFVCRRQLFDSSYIEFLTNFFYRVLNSEVMMEEEKRKLIVSLGTTFTLKVLSRSKDYSCFFLWSLILRKIFYNDVLSACFFIDFCLEKIDSKETDYDDNFMYRHLLDCETEEVRMGFSDLIVTAVKVFHAHELRTDTWPRDPNHQVRGSSATCDVLYSLFSMFDVSRKHHRRFRQYFEVIRNLSLLGVSIREFLLNKMDIISEYRCYYMNNSTRTGKYTHYVILDTDMPDLRYFIDTIRIFYCGCANEQQQETELKSPDYIPSEPDEGRGFFSDGRTPFSLEQVMPFGRFKWDRIIDTIFLPSVIEMDYSPISVSTIVKHTCWQCPERSRWLVIMILDNLTSSALNKQNFFGLVLESLLTLEDNYQDMRIRLSLNTFPVGIGFLSTQNRNPKGLLGILTDYIHKSFYDKAKYVIFLLMYIQSVNKKVQNFLCERKLDVISIRDYLASKIEWGDDKTRIRESELIVPLPTKNTDVPYTLLYHVCNALLNKVGSGSDSLETIELIQKKNLLEEELASNRREAQNLRNTLTNLLTFYKMNCPHLPPPDTLDLSQYGSWVVHTSPQVPTSTGLAVNHPQKGATMHTTTETTGGISTTSTSKSESEDVQDRTTTEVPKSAGSGGDHPAYQVVGPFLQDPADMESKVLMLVEILQSSVEVEVLKAALRHEKYDVHHTIDKLFDPEYVQSFRREMTLAVTQSRSVA
eukprot:TRINITY_DN7065_c0_g1_i5.p1 TRINITY_DN7065_c0_g1~~TRINITY_DN7065_c0_g1_i5.p1  ORF type:complete len:997 (-),score=195.46 TRINITY_DN7065_c0_g1_i5:106-3066(-)